MQIIFASERFKVGQVGAIGQQVIPLSAPPAFGKSRIVDEDLGSIWRIRAVFKIVVSPVEEERTAVGVEEHRREGVVGVRLDQLAWWANALKTARERPAISAAA